MDNLLSQMGIGAKHISERYSEYSPSVQDQHVYYAYEPALTTHGHTTHEGSTKYNYGSGLKSNASMSALTLLAFLFFLHILQQCIKEHMTEMNSSPLMVMTAGRESEDLKSVADKLDETGISKVDVKNEIYENDKKSTAEQYHAKNPFQYIDSVKKNVLTKVKTTEPTNHKEKYKYAYKNEANHHLH